MYNWYITKTRIRSAHYVFARAMVAFALQNQMVKLLDRYII